MTQPKAEPIIVFKAKSDHSYLICERWKINLKVQDCPVVNQLWRLTCHRQKSQELLVEFDKVHNNLVISFSVMTSTPSFPATPLKMHKHTLQKFTQWMWRQWLLKSPQGTFYWFGSSKFNPDASHLTSIKWDHQRADWRLLPVCYSVSVWSAQSQETLRNA